MEQASPDLLAILAPAMLAFRVHLAFLSPRLTFLPVCERGRGASPFLDGSRIWMAEFPGASEQLTRTGLPGSFERLERGVLRLRLFGLRMRLPCRREGGLWQGLQFC